MVEGKLLAEEVSLPPPRIFSLLLSLEPEESPRQMEQNEKGRKVEDEMRITPARILQKNVARNGRQPPVWKRTISMAKTLK